jgi:hypothetical protein
LDLPFFTSLLMQNTRSRRIFQDQIARVEFWEQLPPAQGVRSYAEAGGDAFTDAFGSVVVRRRRLGAVAPDEEDGSAKVTLPGGVPISVAAPIQLAGEDAAGFHHQREATQFYPGEVVRQGFPRTQFANLCGGCHGSVSGRESEISVNPDILTQASQVAARSRNPTDLTGNPSDVQGPPFP